MLTVNPTGRCGVRSLSETRAGARLPSASFFPQRSGKPLATPGSVGTLPHAAANLGPPQLGMLPSPPAQPPPSSSAFIPQIKDNNLKAVLEIQEVILFLR